MPPLEKQHYVQKKLLDNFAVKTSNDKYKICLLDILEFKAEYRNTESVFHAKNLYDVKEDDVKSLEINLKVKIEDPAMNIIERILKMPYKIILTRTELETLKKYILIQIYRNYRNMTGYTNPKPGIIEMSSYNLREGEDKLDFWKREMATILENDWNDVVTKIELSGVKKYAQEIHTGFLMFFSTDNEFVINDSGVVMERIPVEIPQEMQEDYIRIAKECAKTLGINNGDEHAKAEIERESSYMDNLIFLPISSNYAIANVNFVWKYYQLNLLDKLTIKVPLKSAILTNHLSLPKNSYVNIELMKSKFDSLNNAEIIECYKDKNDSYEYETHKLNAYETIYINNLMMNEAFRYLCFKTPQAVIPSIRSYNMLNSNNFGNMKKNYNGFVELLQTLKPFQQEDNK